MGYQKKIKLWPNERLDLPDIQNLQDYFYEFLGKSNQNLTAATQFIVSGFVTQNNGGIDIKIETKDSVALNIESSGTGVEGILFMGSNNAAVDIDLISTLTDNSTNYIEIELYVQDSAPDTRAFWDPTANSGAGDEFNSVVNTCSNVQVRLRINTVAFSSNPDYIPVSRVVTSGGSISDIYDERPLFFRLNSDYSWPDGRAIPSNTSFSGADKSITHWKEWVDSIMTTLKEIKGSEWYESTFGSVSLSDLLQDRNITLIKGDDWDWNEATNTLSLGSISYLDVPGISRDRNRILAGSNTDLDADGKLLYVDINRTSGAIANLTINSSTTEAFVIDSDRFVIAKRVDDLIVLYNGQIVSRPHVYNETEFIEEGNEYDYGDTITLPFDSKLSPPAARNYRVGTNQLQIYINGIRQHNKKRILVDSILPHLFYAYLPLEGSVLIPHLPPLVEYDTSAVRVGDIFQDGNGVGFKILGVLDNIGIGGIKIFKINSGQTVNTTSPGQIYRRDYKEDGTDWSYQTTITILKKIPSNASIHYRIDDLDKAVAGSSGGGGGGASNLQDAYDGGRTIAVSSGNPIEISGPPGEKLFKVNGDIDITGIIDPKGITFDPQVSNPGVGLNTLYLNSGGDLVLNNTISGLVQNINGGVPSVVSYTNGGISSIPKGRLFKKTGLSSIDFANWTTLINSAVAGITLENINQGNSGETKRFGEYIPNTVFETTSFIEGVLPQEGYWLYLGPADGKMTITPPSQGSGYSQVPVGIWDNGGLIFSVSLWGIA